MLSKGKGTSYSELQLHVHVGLEHYRQKVNRGNLSEGYAVQCQTSLVGFSMSLVKVYSKTSRYVDLGRELYFKQA